MSAATLDPALEKLLDELGRENGDPDHDRRVEISCPWTPQRHVVYRGQMEKLEFGPWAGPPTPLRAIPFVVRCLHCGKGMPYEHDTGLEGTIIAGGIIRAIVCVVPEVCGDG